MDEVIQASQVVVAPCYGLLHTRLIIGLNDVAPETQDLTALDERRHHTGPETPRCETQDRIHAAHRFDDRFISNDDPVRNPGRPSFERLMQ